MLRLLIVAIFGLIPFCGLAQCLPGNFTTPSTTCLQQSINTNYTPSGNEESFSWDFCDGSILQTATGTSLGAISSFSSVFDIAITTEGSIPVVFTANQGDHTIKRLLFSNGLTQAPTVFSAVTSSDGITGPGGIAVYEESGLKYGVVGTLSGKVFLLSFGTSYLNKPTVSLITSGYNDVRHLSVVHDNSTVYILLPASVLGGSSGVLTILTMGSSITNNVQSAQNIAISGSTYLTGLEAINECGNWYIVLGGYLSGLHLVSFGSSLSNTPSSIKAISGVSLPLGISLQTFNGNKYLFVSSSNGGGSNSLLRVDFGSSVNNTAPVVNNLGNYGGLLNFAIAFNMAPVGSKYYGIAVGYSNKDLIILDFPKTCTITNDFKNVASPTVVYTNSGTQKIGLKIYGKNGAVTTVTKDIIVQSGIAPDIDFTNSAACVSQNVNFTSQNTSGNISTYAWDFGDGNSSMAYNPSNAYAASGTFDVNLTVTATNGCTNSVQHAVSIFNIPQTDFDLPAIDPICSNQTYTFTNTTVADVGANPTWEWRVNGTLLAATKDLSYQITNTTPLQIKLKALVPGCENEKQKDINTIITGPVVDFLFSNNCQGTVIQFMNNSTGATSFSWNFGDGHTSTQIDAGNAFSTAGDYNVTLTASSSAGCINTATKSIKVYSNPQTNFSLALPPFSCSGTASQFTDSTPDLTDSNLLSWSWNFGDTGSSQNTSTQRSPQHTYATAGDYAVNLTVTTNFGCQTSLQKTVTIAATPSVTINNTPSCLNSMTAFTGVTSDNIATWSWQIGNIYFSTSTFSYQFAASGNYTINLTAISSNGCVRTTSKAISVPAVLSPDFTFTKNCIDHQTAFTDITGVKTDPISTREWNFADAGTATGATATYAFPALGTYPVTLKITTQIGCVYTSSKDVLIDSPPQAGFSATPEVGVPPLKVQFTNTSIGATSYLWNFNDPNNSTSTQTSPQFTFQNYGNYVVDLTAFNAQGCSAIVSKLIKAEFPLYDVSLESFTIVENTNNTYSGTIIIHNTGNTTLYTLPVQVDIGGIVVQETITGELDPNLYSSHTLNFNILKNDNIDFICAVLDVPDDVTPNNNRQCAVLGPGTYVYQPYPNPSQGELTIDWVASESQLAVIQIYNRIGTQHYLEQFTSKPGLNSHKMVLDKLEDGIYFLVLNNGKTYQTFRFLISR